MVPATRIASKWTVFPTTTYDPVTVPFPIAGYVVPEFPQVGV